MKNTGIDNHVKVQFLPINTVGLPFFKKIVRWRSKSRKVVLLEDWLVTLPDGNVCKIPAGFVTDGSSLPRLLRWIDDPFGVSVGPGIAHDFAYKYRCLLLEDGEIYLPNMTRWQADDLFKRMNLQINDLLLLAILMYIALRLFGSFAWRYHRRNDVTNDLSKYRTTE